MTDEVTIKQQSGVVPHQYTYSELERMAIAVAKSGLFGVKTPEAALTLMLIANEEKTGVAAACRDYHIIEGKPALRADAMLARFQAAGGNVEWHELTDKKAEATFSYPGRKPLKLEWNLEMAKTADLYPKKDNWRKYPRAMLRSRLISEGIRSVYPGSIIGVYEVNEIRDGIAEETDDPTVVATQTPGEPTDTKHTPGAGSLSTAGNEPVTLISGAAATGKAPEAEQRELLGLPPDAVESWVNAIKGCTTANGVKRAHADAYRVAHAIGDNAALLKFEVAKKETLAIIEEAARAVSDERTERGHIGGGK